jgi:hypothetical protein
MELWIVVDQMIPDVSLFKYVYQVGDGICFFLKMKKKQENISRNGKTYRERGLWISDDSEILTKKTQFDSG